MLDIRQTFKCYWNAQVPNVQFRFSSTNSQLTVFQLIFIMSGADLRAQVVTNFYGTHQGRRTITPTTGVLIIHYQTWLNYFFNSRCVCSQVIAVCGSCRVITFSIQLFLLKEVQINQKKQNTSSNFGLVWNHGFVGNFQVSQLSSDFRVYFLEGSAKSVLSAYMFSAQISHLWPYKKKKRKECVCGNNADIWSTNVLFHLFQNKIRLNY